MQGVLQNTTCDTSNGLFLKHNGSERIGRGEDSPSLPRWDIDPKTWMPSSPSWNTEQHDRA